MTGFQCSLDTSTHTHTHIYVHIYTVSAELGLMILGNDVNYIELYRRSGGVFFFFLVLITDNAALLRLGGTRLHQSGVCTHNDSRIGGVFIASHLKNCYTGTMKRWTQRRVCFCGAAGETRACLWELMCIVSSATSLLKHLECFSLSES